MTEPLPSSEPNSGEETERIGNAYIDKDADPVDLETREDENGTTESPDWADTEEVVVPPPGIICVLSDDGLTTRSYFVTAECNLGDWGPNVATTTPTYCAPEWSCNVPYWGESDTEE